MVGRGGGGGGGGVAILLVTACYRNPGYVPAVGLVVGIYLLISCRAQKQRTAFKQKTEFCLKPGSETNWAFSRCKAMRLHIICAECDSVLWTRRLITVQFFPFTLRRRTTQAVLFA